MRTTQADVVVTTRFLLLCNSFLGFFSIDKFGVGGAHFAAAVNGLAVNKKKSLAVADACSDTILRRGERVRTGASKVRAGTVNR